MGNMKCLAQRSSSRVASQRLVQAFQLPGVTRHVKGQSQWLLRAQQQQVCAGPHGICSYSDHIMDVVRLCMPRSCQPVPSWKLKQHMQQALQQLMHT